MAYENFSEIYFARHFTDPTKIKIGETKNAQKRNNQLHNEEYHICWSRDLRIESARYYVEGFLRFYIEQHYDVTRVKKDYFVCKTEEVARNIEKDFVDLVEKAMSFVLFDEEEILYNKNSTDVIDLLTKHIYDFCMETIVNPKIFNEKVYLSFDVLKEWEISRYSKILFKTINRVVDFLQRNYDIIWYAYSTGYATRCEQLGYFRMSV